MSEKDDARTSRPLPACPAGAQVLPLRREDLFTGRTRRQGPERFAIWICVSLTRLIHLPDKQVGVPEMWAMTRLAPPATSCRRGAAQSRRSRLRPFFGSWSRPPTLRTKRSLAVVWSFGDVDFGLGKQCQPCPGVWCNAALAKTENQRRSLPAR